MWLLSGKESACQCSRHRFNPWALTGKVVPGRSPGGGHGNPLQHSCWENPMDRSTWQLESMGITKEWETTERLNSSIKYLLCTQSCSSIVAVRTTALQQTTVYSWEDYTDQWEGNTQKKKKYIFIIWFNIVSIHVKYNIWKWYDINVRSYCRLPWPRSIFTKWEDSLFSRVSGSLERVLLTSSVHATIFLVFSLYSFHTNLNRSLGFFLLELEFWHTQRARELLESSGRGWRMELIQLNYSGI